MGLQMLIQMPRDQLSQLTSSAQRPQTKTSLSQNLSLN